MLELLMCLANMVATLPSLAGAASGAITAFAPVPVFVNEMPAEVKGVLADAEHLTVYLLSNEEGGKRLYNRRVTGGKTVAGHGKKIVLASVYAAIATSDGTALREFKQYRYCLRAIHKGKTVDVLISFAEGKAVIFIDGKMQSKDVRLTSDAKKTLDELLKR